MTTSRRVPLVPSIAVNLGARTGRFPGAYLLALARRSPAAARLATTIDLSDRPEAFPTLFRLAVERVTEVPRRTAALLEGAEIRDELLVPVVLTLGDAALPPGALAELLAQLATIPADFYRGTRIDLHLVALFPDLEGEHAERAARYARAYEHFAVLEEAAAPDRRGADGQPLVSHRWLADCRTGVGAHAGSVDEVLHPIAESLAVRATSDVSRQRDAGCTHVLHGQRFDRPTCYSAIGYAEIVCDPSVLARYAACRTGSDLAVAALQPALDGMTAIQAEERASGCLERMQLKGVANALRRPAREPSVPAGRDRLLRERVREASRESCVAELLRTAIALVDDHGIPTAALVLSAIDDAGAAADGQTIHPPVTLAALDAAARRRLAALVGIARRREAADAHERTATVRDAEATRLDALLERAAAARDAASRAGEQPPDLPDLPDPGDPGRLRTEAEVLCAEAADLRVEADRLEELCSTADDEARLDALHEALTGEVPPSDAPPVPVARIAPPSPPPAETVGPPPRSRLARWIARLRGRGQPRERVPAVPPAATVGTADASDGARTSPARSAPETHDGPSDPHLLVEWIRWIAGFREDLRGVVGALRRFEADVGAVSSHYEREAEVRLDALARGTVFSHRLLSREQCRRLHEERATLVLSGAASALPLSRYFRLYAEPLDTLQHPLNERFDGLDQALDEAAREAFADWMALSCSDILWGDAEVRARARPEDRLRALVDAAQPLARPVADHGDVRAAHVVLLPGARGGSSASDERTADALRSIDAYHEAWDAQSPTRISIRTAVHGFPAFALHQLAPLRERRIRELPDDRLPEDPLPDAAMVDESVLQLVALGRALNVVVQRERCLWHGEVRLAADVQEFARLARHTAAGAARFRDLLAAVARGLGSRGQARMRLRAGLDRDDLALTATERELVEAALADIGYGGWPETLPEPPHGGPELAA